MCLRAKPSTRVIPSLALFVKRVLGPSGAVSLFLVVLITAFIQVGEKGGHLKIFLVALSFSPRKA